MKLCALILLAALAGPSSAQPVHVALKPAAAVSPNSDGFFTLGSVADVTGGAAALRTHLASVLVGRAPLSGETRRLTRGDLALKLRQAGCDPDKAVLLEGAAEARVTREAPPTPNSGGAGEEAAVGTPFVAASSIPAPPKLGVGGAILIHRGDAVAIVIQTGPLTITAPGIAREDGRAGTAIHVHREGVMTDLTVEVVDAKTVRLEI